ncbi:MAG TPA: hypothetical protein EYN91_12500 [Candidatus Melainabacteria bacterium]|jgi:hypothetical protein|nr:hypothetical protein [Candidatus Melainabacteria bacterium]HIN65797.1 hypothetical protein [Candidatus Obscuribacterales bacterium]
MGDNIAGELGYLRGQELFQIAFGSEELVFTLNSDFISVHCPVFFAIGNNQPFEIWTPGGVLKDPAIFRLLHTQIMSFQMNQNEDLKLDFTNGDYLILCKKQNSQGSYQISCGQEVIIV